MAHSPSAPRKILVGLIGAGIGRSMAPFLHEEEARHHGLRLHYQLIDLDDSGADVRSLPTLLEAARIMGFAGLNITFPCKQAVIPLLDDLSDQARAMGAVNTVVIDGGRMVGHNTDGPGWAWGMTRALPNADLSRIALLGAGGAGSAVAHAALAMGAGELVIVDTDPAKASELADNLNAIYGAGRSRSCPSIADALNGASGLIHATPVGMLKLPGMPLPASLLKPSLWVSDVVYVPLETEFLVAARRAGCAVVDGGHMNVGQAFRAFELFTGIEPDAARMDAHFRNMLAQRRDGTD